VGKKGGQIMESTQELTREDIANLKAEEIDKLKEDLDEDPSKETLKETPDSEDDEEKIKEGDDEDKGSDDQSGEGDEDQDKPEPGEADGEDLEETGQDVNLDDPEDRQRYVDQFLKDVDEKQDLSKYDIKELQKIIHVQNKRINDKDSFIETLKEEKRQERAANRERLNKIREEFENKKKQRLSEEELNERYHEDPVGTQKVIREYEKEDQQGEEELTKAMVRDLELTNQELMANVDAESEYSFEELIPETKKILRDMGRFSEQDIETFASKPYQESFEVLMDLRSKAVALKKQNAGTKKTQDNEQVKEKKQDAEIDRKKKEDIAQKINKAQRKTNPLRGTGNDKKERSVADNLRQLNNGKLDLSTLSNDELEKLKRQID
jgi:hypothetical protein